MGAGERPLTEPPAHLPDAASVGSVGFLGARKKEDYQIVLKSDRELVAAGVWNNGEFSDRLHVNALLSNRGRTSSAKQNP